jgi:hypothetical protein
MQPSNADFYHNRGFSNRKLGRYGAATEDYTAALRLNPKHFKVLMYEALSSWVRGLELLVYEVLSYWCMRPSATSV